MLRKIFGVIGGYVAMVLVVMTIFTLSFLAMGTEGAFKPGSFEPSGVWIAVTFVLSFAAAVLGGWICVLIARSFKTALVFAGIVVVLGMLLAIPVLTADPPTEARTGELSNLEAMQKGHQPGWVALLNPLVGAFGIIAGARLKSR